MFKRFFYLLIYYGLLKNLPEGYDHPAFRIFDSMRAWACKGLFGYCGDGVRVHKGAHIGAGQNIKVGNYSNIGVNARINGRGGVILGEHVLMGPDIIIYTGTHVFTDINMPIQRQEMQYTPVVIGDDVWIGARVIIMPGVVLGDGCVVGANSVVTKDLPPFSVSVGSPASVIKYRK